MFSIIDIETGRFGKKITSAGIIPKGTVIHHFSGTPVTFAETKKLREKESYALQIGPDDYLLLDEPACFFNHACEPNCGLTPSLELIALQEIPGGAELCYDYSTTMLERSWTMKCECKKSSCRGIVEDFDKLPLALQKKYLLQNIVQHFIVETLKTGWGWPGI